MEPEWNYGIMEPAQTTARVRDQDGTGQDGQDRTRHQLPLAHGTTEAEPGPQESGYCYGVHMLMHSHAAMQQPSTGTDRGGKGGPRFDSILI